VASRREIVVATLVLFAALLHPPAARADVVVRPGDDLAALVDAHPPGTAFRIAAGVHRGQQVRPKDGDRFTGEVGAVLSGAVVLEGWQREGAYWTLPVALEAGQAHGACDPRIAGYEGCRLPEDLFFDDEPLWQETSLSALDRSGEWFFDYAAGRIYVLDDPAAAVVELGVTRHAFHGAARDVVIEGLVIEKYAAPAQHAAVHGREGTSGAMSRDWVVRDCLIRLNHGLAIRTGDGMRVIGNAILRNGQLGIGGQGEDVLVEGNLIQSNNYAGFDPRWEAGGAKWTRTLRLTVRGNVVEDNRGPGLWTDIDNLDSLYEENVVRGNSDAGIFHEISEDAVIRNNVVQANGFDFDEWLWGAQILVSTSRNVDVHDNEVTVARRGGNGIALVQQDRGAGAYGTRATENDLVHDNTIVYLGGSGWSGAAADYAVEAFFAAGNRFESNTYVLADPRDRRWVWGHALAWDEWQGAGHDLGGHAGAGPYCGLVGIELLALLPLLRRGPRRSG
jgi:parallel beta-helix repeat protein